MKPLNAIAISVGLLVCGWTFLTFTYLEPRVMTWITFLTWASFFAAGGGSSGLAKSIASGIVGVLASAAVIWLNTQIGLESHQALALSLLLGILGWFLCAVSALPLLSCIPAGFIGAAAFFGAGSPVDVKLVWILCSVTIGALLGLASQKLAGALTKPDAESAPRSLTPRKQS
jgi:hypothetical protein